MTDIPSISPFAAHNATPAAANSAPALSVIVCVHNAYDYTRMCLDSVLRHTPRPYELIIVNDGSALQTRELVQHYAETYSHVQLITHAEAQGYTVAANAGLRAARGRYLVLLNSDTLVSPGWSEGLIACAESRTDTGQEGGQEIGIVGPLSNAATYQSIPEVRDARGHWVQNRLPEGMTVSHFAQLVRQVSLRLYPRVPIVNGFCFFLKRAVLERIGYLDAATFPRGYGEENDFCIRAADAGFALAIADDVYVYHATSQSFGNANREAYTNAAHHAIRAKHGEARLNQIDQALQQHAELARIRAHIKRYQLDSYRGGGAEGAATLLPTRDAAQSVLFLMPGCTPTAGGTQAVVEIARGLEHFGFTVSIAIERSTERQFAEFFPEQQALFFAYETLAQLEQHAAQFHALVATIFLSITPLAHLLKRFSEKRALYFVQDYEPNFLEETHPLKPLALSSYSLLPQCRLLAISPWVKEMVETRHHTPVQLITGAIDLEQFFPHFARLNTPSTPLVISAMVRPATPWRNPALTMRVLHRLQAAYGARVQLQIFGATRDELSRHGLALPENSQFFGVLSKPEVATLLRQSDVFCDFSTFQAFGKTALEAMACGNAVIAPKTGGVSAFGKDGENIILVDTADEEACYHAVAQLIEQPAEQKRLAYAGARTARAHSIHASAWEFAEAIAHAEHAQSAGNSESDGQEVPGTRKRSAA